MLKGLADRIKSSRSNRVFVVLHLAGSHDPDYYKKYPVGFEIFKPICQSVDLQKCTSQELINAYDNTITYTDHVAAQAITLLKGMPAGTSTSLIYISDHGESLGEYGLYLHGAPYSIAPNAQKDIPFIVWMSDEFKRYKNICQSELDAHSTPSQANIFHSVMGAFDMRSQIYDATKDTFTSGPREARP